MGTRTCSCSLQILPVTESGSTCPGGVEGDTCQTWGVGYGSVLKKLLTRFDFCSCSSLTSVWQCTKNKGSFCSINRLGSVTSALLGVLAHSRCFKKLTQRTAKCDLFFLGNKYVCQVPVARQGDGMTSPHLLLPPLCSHVVPRVESLGGQRSLCALRRLMGIGREGKSHLFRFVREE